MAEDIIPEKTETPIAEQPEVTPETKPETPAEAKPVSEETKADPKDRHATLREAMIAKGLIKPAEKPRDQKSGQFVPAAKPQAAPAPEPVSFPKSLKKDMEAYWKTVHPDLQKAYLQRDADYEKGISTYKQQAEQAATLLAEFKPYEQMMRVTGATPMTTIRNLLPTMAILATGSPAEKAYMMAQALRQYGIPLEHIQQVMQSGLQGVQQQNPEYMALQQQMQAIQQNLENVTREREQMEGQRLSVIAETFGKGKPHFDTLRPQMWSLLQAQDAAEKQGLQGPFGSAADTAGWPEEKWVEMTYNAALRLNPELYQSELARQREEAARAEREKATREAQASRQAAVQVRGAPSAASSSTALDPRDRRAVIAAAMRSRIT